MNAYEALLKAADKIERHPDSYAFTSNAQPDCGTPGCMLGWTGVFLGVKRNQIFTELWASDAARAMGTTLRDFLEDCRKLSKTLGQEFGYQRDPVFAAKTLRAYAEKYHGHEKPQRRTDAELVADLKSKLASWKIGDAQVSEELTW